MEQKDTIKESFSYLCTREEPLSPFIVGSNRASEPIKIIVKFNGGLRYAPQN